MFQAVSTQHLGQSSLQPDYFYPAYFDGHFYIQVALPGGPIGFLRGTRSGQLIRFACKSDAARFCAGRNRSERQRVCVVSRRSAKEVA